MGEIHTAVRPGNVKHIVINLGPHKSLFVTEKNRLTIFKKTFIPLFCLPSSSNLNLGEKAICYTQTFV